MLPDQPEVKRDLADRLTDFVEARRQFHMGPLGEIVRIRIPEGDRHILVRQTGEVEEVKFNEIRASFTVMNEDLPNLTLESLLQRLDQVALDMAEQMARGVYESIKKAVDSDERTIDAGGSRLTAQHILDSFATLELDFNSDGTPRLPGIHIHPNLSEALEAALQALDQDPELRKQFGQLLSEKKEAWRAREANRRLVG